ncbi:pyrroloquinoline quinone-dependent dehydrogenase [Gluconacetobacter tumulicola]|uniref:PQQ-binding-like beta-propeller repeat protein n=1 Tax=Gluconacetobacter tumulicola TaxID=1017177 RepID=A0A7W4P8J4_9PROT|nr:PQQ-binding-like beta-propeller repeat protein [Gluconacetobacter tumulicola]MBB2179428.1 PQQ-binding-like beta-propeller repeat protein [Gluconacetobacter tumulicola]
MSIFSISSMSTKKKLLTTAAAAIIGGGGIGSALVYKYWFDLVPPAGLVINWFRTIGQAPGTLATETASSSAPISAHADSTVTEALLKPDTLVTESAQETASPASAGATPETTEDWPSYNKTLTSQRFSSMTQINTTNVKNLKVQCTYDTKEYTSFETGPLMVDGALIGTTEHDIFSLNPEDCHENWRTHEEFPAALLRVNRGAAYADGMLYRGTSHGDVIAYDFKTGKRLWTTNIGNGAAGESVPAAPIVWGGRVYIGNAGGDVKGVKGRMYALDAKTGHIIWEFYMVPREPNDPTRGPQGKTPLDLSTWKNPPGMPITGGGTWTSYSLDPDTGELYIPGGNPAPDYVTATREGKNLFSDSIVVLDAATGEYKRHYELSKKDWHDWDASNPPVLLQTRNGRKLLAVAPKNGYLYGFDMATGGLLYKTPATRIENTDAPFEVGKTVHFCPGSVGGDEWNSPGYDPRTNLVMVGEVEWCGSVTTQSDAQLKKVSPGEPWSGMDTHNPYHMFSAPDSAGQWAGWLSGIDADTGAWKWRVKTNYPIQSGITPTAGGLTFFGDMGGYFYALDSETGKKLWGEKIDGAIGGGVITYTFDGSQKIAVATGFTSILWPTVPTTGKIVILGL